MGLPTPSLLSFPAFLWSCTAHGSAKPIDCSAHRRCGPTSPVVQPDSSHDPLWQARPASPPAYNDCSAAHQEHFPHARVVSALRLKVSLDAEAVQTQGGVRRQDARILRQHGAAVADGWSIGRVTYRNDSTARCASTGRHRMRCRGLTEAWNGCTARSQCVCTCKCSRECCAT